MLPTSPTKKPTQLWSCCLRFTLICGLLLLGVCPSRVHGAVLKKRETNATATQLPIDPDTKAAITPKFNESESTYSVADVATSLNLGGNHVTRVNGDLDEFLNGGNNSTGDEEEVGSHTTEEILRDLEEVAVRSPVAHPADATTKRADRANSLAGDRLALHSEESGSGDDNNAEELSTKGLSGMLSSSLAAPQSHHLSNEIRSHSAEKRAKFISDNSTNAQQLNLPDAAEVWSLAGMKSVPKMNSSLTPEHMERLVLNETLVEAATTVGSVPRSTTEGGGPADAPNTSNSEKNLLDWTQIMLMNTNSLDAKREALEPHENRTEALINSTVDSTDSDAEAMQTVTQPITQKAAAGEISANKVFEAAEEIRTTTTTSATTTTTTTAIPLLSVTLEKQTPSQMIAEEMPAVTTTTPTGEAILSLRSGGSGGVGAAKDNGIAEAATTPTPPTTTGAISDITLSASDIVTGGAGGALGAHDGDVVKQSPTKRRDEILDGSHPTNAATTIATPAPSLPSTDRTTAPTTLVGTKRNETPTLRESSENDLSTTTTTTTTTTTATPMTMSTALAPNTREENNENNEVVTESQPESLSTREPSATSTPVSLAATTTTTSTAERELDTAKTQEDSANGQPGTTSTLAPYRTAATTTVIPNFLDSAVTTPTTITPTSTTTTPTTTTITPTTTTATPITTTTTPTTTTTIPTSSHGTHHTPESTTDIAQIDQNIGHEIISSSTPLPESPTAAVAVATSSTTHRGELLLVTEATTARTEIAETLGATPTPTANDLAHGSTDTTTTTTTAELTTPKATATAISDVTTTTPTTEEIIAADGREKVAGVKSRPPSSIDSNVIDPVPDRDKTTTLKPVQLMTTTPTSTPTTTAAAAAFTEATTNQGHIGANKPERPFKALPGAEETHEKDNTGNTVDEEDGEEEGDFKSEHEEGKHVLGGLGEKEKDTPEEESEREKGEEENQQVETKTMATTTEASSRAPTTTTVVSQVSEASTETATTTTTTTATMESTTKQSTTQPPPLISLLDDSTTSTTTTTTLPPTAVPSPTIPTPISTETPSTIHEEATTTPSSTSSTTPTTKTTTTTPIPATQPAVVEVETSSTPMMMPTTTTTTPSPQDIFHASIGRTNTGSGAGMLPTNLPGVTNLDSMATDSASGGTDVNVIIAVSVGVIGVIAAILLVTFLYLIRKRQKQMSYGQRCRPVSLDAYSLDNVSVLGSVRRKGALRASKRSYGNVAFDDPALRHNVLNASELSKFVEKRSQIFEEFRDVPQIIVRADEVPAGCEDKNRYANVIPLPETRVLLQQRDGDEKTEYINANYVRGPKDAPNYYIACQAPMEITVADFWRMIWEQRSRVIVQATDLIENGFEKCAEYLPPSVTLDNHTTYGDFQVTLKNREVKDKYAISTIMLKHIETEDSRELTHYWYKWPEAGVPTEVAPIIAMLLEVRTSLKTYAIEEANAVREQNSTLSLKSVDETPKEKQNGSSPASAMQSGASGEINGNVSAEKLKAAAKSQGPLTIHCSPGTGRTGTIIACDMAIRSLETPKRSVDIPQLVYYVRMGRASAVQTREQYEIIYKVANMYATKITNMSNEN